MNNNTKIEFDDLDKIQKIIDEIVENISENETENHFEENFEALPENLKESFQNSMLNNDLGSYFKSVQNYYENSPRITNPEAIKKIAIIRKSIYEIKKELVKLDFENENDFVIIENIENLFGWTYTLKVRV